MIGATGGVGSQAPTDVVMVRPRAFTPNPLTAADNMFQPRVPVAATPELAQQAWAEVTRMADDLSAVGVAVHLFDDDADDRPDSVFANNWISTHPDGRLAIYPMFSANRRSERRSDIIQSLRAQFQINAIYDYSVLEDDGLFLEGTGSMVLDHINRVAYVARSFRSHDRAAELVCRDLGYEPVMFSTADVRGTPIYHTNVMMSVGTRFALVCLDAIDNEIERRAVEGRLAESGRTVVSLSLDQVDEFAGNAIELTGDAGPYLALSTRACESLTKDQRRTIMDFAYLLPIPVPTIELAGGSVRCMIAGVHLPRRQVPRQSSLRPASTAGAVV